eukprot:TRINITY_DN1378_c0_g1_i7.p1 TRINITY_DN1378_c0_g1~~TRINITY_DN1378_c0_g1_i7.p1  ORF type:complete len:176 (-),score=41.64 TRINITY_DN1378_c0_g1_i7:112-639(-)
MRNLPRIHRAARPARVDKARRLGWRSKQGFVVYRCRVRRGDRKRRVRKGIVCGKPKHQGIHQQKSTMSLKRVAEGRVGKMCSNLRVLNSYWINQDALYKYFEVILIDPQHKGIRRDARYNWICATPHKHRELHGLTSAGKKFRGLRGKGFKHKKARPSRRGSWKRRNTLSLRRYR